MRSHVPCDSGTIAAVLLIVLVCGVLAAADDGHWAFRPVAHPVPPTLRFDGDACSPIDRFIHARLEREGLDPSASADRHTLIRRVTLDLTGLPPTPDEVDAFLSDDRPDAYERLVDRLLASPHYGEHFARGWLDLCHYGDTDGHLTDQMRPVAWRYRDWVINALNANMPFDEFTRLQLAGDLIAERSPAANLAEAVDPRRLHAWLGTGFLRQTLSNREGGADLEEYRVEQIVDRTSMVGTIWLGLTVGCARCHDHKYDPLTQTEFYQLYAYFDQADEINIDAPLPHERAAYLEARPEYDRRRSELVARWQPGLDELQKRWEVKLLHAASHPGENHVWDRQWEVLGLIWGGHLGEGQLEGTEIVKLPWEQRTPRQQADLLDYFLKHGAVVDPDRFAELKLAELDAALHALREEFPAAAATRAPVVRVALTPRETAVHEAGDFRSPGERVQPATPAWLPPSASSSTPRLALAEWLTSPDNPLTPRVVANRAWQWFFGRGLVATEADFGLRGDPPTHPELLDWLARRLLESGWDIKGLHRLIVTSSAYRQSSRPRPELESIDPDNTLLARQSSLRVPAEVVRDAALSVSGLIEHRLGGPGVYPPQSESVTMEGFGYNKWTVSQGADRYRRGLYTLILRTTPFAQAITFDAPAPLATCARRDRSNTPLQALTLLNDPVFVELAQALGRRIERDGGASDSQRIEFAIRLCLSRPPAAGETERILAYLEQARSARQRAGPPDESRTWADVAHVLLNLHEFITRD